MCSCPHVSEAEEKFRAFKISSGESFLSRHGKETIVQRLLLGPADLSLQVVQFLRREEILITSHSNLEIFPVLHVRACFESENLLEVIWVATSHGVEMVLLLDDVAPPRSTVELFFYVFEIKCKTVSGVDERDRDGHTQMRQFHAIVTFAHQNFLDLRPDRFFDRFESWGEILPSLDILWFDFLLQGFLD